MFSTKDLQLPSHLRELLGDQSFITGVTSFHLHFTFYDLVRFVIDTKINSAPKVDDPIRWFVEQAIGGRLVERTGLHEDVAFVRGSLDKFGFV